MSDVLMALARDESLRCLQVLMRRCKQTLFDIVYDAKISDSRLERIFMLLREKCSEYEYPGFIYFTTLDLFCKLAQMLNSEKTGCSHNNSEARSDVHVKRLCRISRRIVALLCLKIAHKMHESPGLAAKPLSFADIVVFSRDIKGPRAPQFAPSSDSQARLLSLEERKLAKTLKDYEARIIVISSGQQSVPEIETVFGAFWDVLLPSIDPQSKGSFRGELHWTCLELSLLCMENSALGCFIHGTTTATMKFTIIIAIAILICRPALITTIILRCSQITAAVEHAQERNIAVLAQELRGLTIGFLSTLLEECDETKLGFLPSSMRRLRKKRRQKAQENLVGMPFSPSPGGFEGCEEEDLDSIFQIASALASRSISS